MMNLVDLILFCFAVMNGALLLRCADARANCIPIPTYSVITGELDLQLLEENFGFSEM